MATGQLSGDVIQHARGLYANYDSYVSQASVNKAGLVYYCTDAEGTAYHGCIVYNGTIYGQGNGGIESITTAEQTLGILVTLTLKDGSIKTFTIPKGTSATYGVVKVANSITGDNADPSLVPSYRVVKALDTNKAPKASPNFTGTPKINDQEIATKEDVTNAISANDAMRYKGTLGTNGDVTALPNITSTDVKNGDTYKVVTADRYNGTTTAKVGDMYIANKDTTTTGTWDYVPSGDETETLIQIGNGTAQSGVVKLGDVVTKTVLPSDANATDTDDSYVPTEKRVQSKIDALKNTIGSKVNSVSSDTLDVTNVQQNINIELPEVGTAGTKGGMGSTQTPDFGDIVSIAGVVVDEYGRVTGSGQPHSLIFPSKTASTEQAGLMSATDKIALNNIATALKWIDVTA